MGYFKQQCIDLEETFLDKVNDMLPSFERVEAFVFYAKSKAESELPWLGGEEIEEIGDVCRGLWNEYQTEFVTE